MLEAKLLGVSVAERTAFYIADDGYDPRSIELCWVPVVIAVTPALFTEMALSRL